MEGVGEPHRHPLDQVDEENRRDDAEDPDDPFAESLPGGDHHRDDRSGAGHEGDAQRDHGDVRRSRRPRVLLVPRQELQRHDCQEEAAGYLHGFHGDAQDPQNVVTEESECRHDAQGGHRRLEGGPLAFVRSHLRRQGDEDGQVPRRIGDHEYRRERREEEQTVGPGHEWITSRKQPEARARRTSGAVVFSPSRFGLPDPW